jgi:hypothetical protein
MGATALRWGCQANWRHIWEFLPRAVPLHSPLILMTMKRFSQLSLLLVLLVLSACGKPEPTAVRCKKADQVVFKGNFGTHTVDTAFTLPADISVLLTLFDGERRALPDDCASDASLTFWAQHDTLGHLQMVMNEACPQFSYVDGDSVLTLGLGAQPAVAFLRNIVAAKAPRSAIADLKWMLGKWTQVEENGAVSFEGWEQLGANQLAGYAFTLMGKDTVFQEKLSLESEGKAIYYVVTGAGNEAPVRFKLTSLVEHHAIFENKLHDFPQMIEYKALGDSGLQARISGIQNGQYGAKDFPLKRVR